MSTLIEIRKVIEDVRFDFFRYAAEAKRRRVPVADVAGLDALKELQLEVSEAAKDAEGQSTDLYNRAVNLHNAITEAIEDAPRED